MSFRFSRGNEKKVEDCPLCGSETAIAGTTCLTTFHCQQCGTFRMSRAAVTRLNWLNDTYRNLLRTEVKEAHLAQTVLEITLPAETEFKVFHRVRTEAAT